MANDGSNEDASFSLKDSPVENQRRLSVIVIGAGFSGIYAAIRIPEKLRNIELVVYEKNEGVGGVWWMNRYPGVACDIPSYSYQYSFAPNPYWSSLYAPGSEIRAYLDDVAQRFGASRFIKTSHQVQECAWDSKDNTWTVTVENLKTGQVFQRSANIVITARGNLNEIAWPKIPGLASFKGKVMHSADWDESVDLSHKRVGVIGNGSSSIQIVPSIRKLSGTTVWCFARSPTWISPKFGDMALTKLGLDPKDTEFSRKHQERLARDPELYFKWRKIIEDDGNLVHPATIRGTEMQLGGQKFFQLDMESRLQSRPELVKTMIPKFAPGCRRLTPGPGYLEALCRDNVTVKTSPITAITETGIKLDSGEEMELDVLVCATGFLVGAAPNFKVVGRGGQTLAERWSPHAESYLSVAIDGFPNYLMIGGPNSAIGAGSLTMMLESMGDYVVKVVRKLQKEDYATIEVKCDRVDDFSQYIDEYFKDTVYTDECSSWYRAGRKGSRIVALWPGSTLHCLEALRSPRWEDYEYTSGDSSPNKLRWLGNGWSKTLLEGDPSWYLNPDELDVPQEPKPEEKKRWNIHPYSH